MQADNSLISLQTHKEVTRLYKSFLELVEDIRNDHDSMVKKISDKFGEPAARELDYFTQSKYEQIRKRVLDNGNESARQILNFLDFYDFSINKDKLEIAVAQRKIIKKFTTSSPVRLQ